MKWLAAALALKAVTHVPVLLPQYVPFAPPYAIVEERTTRSYSIDFAWVPTCNGAHVCSMAHMLGSRDPLPLGFHPAHVYAYCNDATLGWRVRGYYYEITLTCGTLKQLQAMRSSVRRY